MLKLNKILLIISLVFPIFAYAQNTNTANEEKTAQYLASIENNPLALQMFLANMPKGGDLHNHFAGAFYAENLLQDAANDKSCFDPETFTISNGINCKQMRLKDVISHPDVYENTVDAWSLRNFIPTSQESVADHFFATFPKFLPVLSNHNGAVLSEIKKRNAAEHVDYLELIIASAELNMPMGHDGDPATALGDKVGWNNDFAKMRAAYLANGLPQIVKETRQHLDMMEQASNQQLHCGTSQADPACKVQVRYEYYALRDWPRAEFFSQLVTAFELANQDPRIVGINIVRPEDDYLSTEDYTLEMHMLNYLHSVYPKVHIALHAGELNMHDVAPEQLRFHIRQAIEIGDAERIGHGTDIAYEDNSAQLLNEMATKYIPVEISLTSNARLLGISGNQHPLPLYLAYHVPVTLATDDEGILRTNLTHEYAIAISTYHLSYPVVKNIVRNGITYSFLPGASLWQNAATATPVSACASDVLGSNKPSAACQQFLNGSEKARMQWQLENEFTAFEQSIAQMQ